MEFVKSFVAFVFRIFSCNRKRDTRKMLKRSFQKTAKSEKNIFRNILHPFELLLNQPFVYSFAVKKILWLVAEISDFKKRLNFDYSIFKKNT